MSVFCEMNLIPVHSGLIPIHFGIIPVHSGLFRFIPVHSVPFRSIPVHSGLIPVHSVPFRSIPVSFRSIPVHSGSFRFIPVHSGHSVPFRCLVTPHGTSTYKQIMKNQMKLTYSVSYSAIKDPFGSIFNILGEAWII